LYPHNFVSHHLKRQLLRKLEIWRSIRNYLIFKTMVEKFEIKLAEEIPEVILNEDGSYTIFNSEGKVGNITPEVHDT
jgi:hypothetical protein